MASEVKVQIKCANEGLVVGTIEVPEATNKKGFLLSSRFIWNGFQPVTEEYRLPRKMSGDGHLLRCPRCRGMLCVSGENKTSKAETDEVKQAREETRQRIIDKAKAEGETHEFVTARGIDPSLVPITLGKTRIAAKQ